MVELRTLAVQLEGSLLMLREGFLVSIEEETGRQQAPRLEVDRIDRQAASKALAGLREVPIGQPEAAQRLVSAGVLRVHRQRLFKLLLSHGVAPTADLKILQVIFSQRNHAIGEGRILLERLAEGFPGIWIIELVLEDSPPFHQQRLALRILVLGLGKHDLVGILEAVEMDQSQAHLHELIGLELLGLLEAERLVDVDHIVPDLRRLLTPAALADRLTQAVQSRDVAAIQLDRLPEQGLRRIELSRTQTDLPRLRLELRRRCPFRRGLENIERLFITAGGRPGSRETARQALVLGTRLQQGGEVFPGALVVSTSKTGGGLFRGGLSLGLPRFFILCEQSRPGE